MRLGHRDLCMTISERLLSFQFMHTGCWTYQHLTKAKILMSLSWWAGFMSRYSLHQCLAYSRKRRSCSACLPRSRSSWVRTTFSSRHCVALGNSSSSASRIPVGTLLSGPARCECNTPVCTVDGKASVTDKLKLCQQLTKNTRSKHGFQPKDPLPHSPQEKSSIL